MGKMSELDSVVTELHKCGETLVELSKTLGGIFGEDVTDKESTQTPQQQEAQQEPTQRDPAPQKPEASKVTLEQLRGVLAEKSVAGHRAEVQALIHEFGAEKLSAVDPSNFAAMLARAEAI